jgi:hypothetical protein
MENKTTLQMSNQKMIWLTVFLTAGLIVAMISLMSRQYFLRTLEKEVYAMKEEVVLQNSLKSLYYSIKNQSNKQNSILNNDRTPTGFERDQISLLPVMMQEVANRSGLKLIQASPELHALNTQANSLAINLILRGNFMNFHNWLIALGNLPYFDRVEEFKLEQTPLGLECQLRVRLYIA